MKHIAILITCHNRKDKTLQCLSSLYRCILPKEYSFDVYLVDDGSTDGTGESVSSNYPDVKIILGDGNLFWNRGMYLAWERASQCLDYDFYLWLNDDTYLFRNAIAEMIEAAISFDFGCIICGVTRATEDSNIVTYGGYDLHHKIIEPNGAFQECFYFNGNFVLIPKIVYQRVGKLDPYFKHSIGDFDYGHRARMQNVKIYTTRIFIGICDLHIVAPKWLDPQVNLWKRLKYLYSPLGCNPFEFYKYERRVNGFFEALVHFFTIHFRAILAKTKK